LKGSEKAEAYAVESLQRARFGLLRGLLNDQEDADDSLFFSAALDSLAIRSEALRSQMVDSYAAVQRAADSAGPASRGRIDLLIERVAEHVKLAPELIRSVVSAESDYRPQAVSPAGARGLMQLMPETAAELGVTDSFDPHQNLLGGSRYLKGLLDKYDGDLDRALAAYNWGQGNVDRHGLARMPDETRRYIARIRQSLERGAA
jgi:soluble lytic murein transglycosylase-like protein